MSATLKGIDRADGNFVVSVTAGGTEQAYLDGIGPPSIGVAAGSITPVAWAEKLGTLLYRCTRGAALHLNLITADPPVQPGADSYSATINLKGV